MKLMGARSAGRSADCNDFILTACVDNLMWGSLACYNLDVGREMRAMGCKARLGGE